MLSFSRLLFLTKLSTKKISQQKKLFAFMTINLFLGLFSFSLIDTFKQSFEKHIEFKKQKMFAADIKVSSRRRLDNKEKKYLLDQFAEKNMATRDSFYSMIANKKKSFLAQILVISSSYPLYGKMIFLNFQGKKISKKEAYKILQNEKNIAVYPEIINVFSLKEGDKVNVLGKVFHARLIVKKDAGSEISFSKLAPRIFISKDQLDTGLLKNSLLNHNLYIKIPKEKNVEKTSDLLYKKLEQIRNEEQSPLSVQSYKTSKTQLESTLSYINSFLSLISLIALFLAGISSAYLFRNFIQEKIKEMAILRSMGMKPEETFFISIWQLCMVGISSSILATIFTIIIAPYASLFFTRFLPNDFEIIYSFRSMITMVFISIFGTGLFCLPTLMATKDISLNYLFTGQTYSIKSNKFYTILSFILIAIFFTITATLFSDSFYIGIIFSVIFFGLFFILLGIGIWSTSTLKWLFSRLAFVPDFAIKSIYFYRYSAILFFISLSLGTMLLSIVTGVQKSIEKEIQEPEGITFPTFFLFNIQSDQIDDLKRFVKNEDIALENISPVINTRITHINDQKIETSKKPFEKKMPNKEKWRERDNRRILITYDYEEKKTNEKILRGSSFAETPDEKGYFKASLEVRFAKSREMDLGDVLTFQILDVPVNFKAKIVNIRKVKWNTYQPNFRILLEPRALENLPKNFIASTSNINKEKKMELQSAIVNKFPNVSILDIQQAIKELSDLLYQLGLLVKIISLFTIVLGCFILFSIIHQQSSSRWREINLLKVLGLSFGKIRKIVIFEYFFLTLFSTVLGMFLGIICSYFISMYIVKSFYFSFNQNAFILVGICLSILLFATIHTEKILKKSAYAVLKKSAVS